MNKTRKIIRISILSFLVSAVFTLCYAAVSADNAFESTLRSNIVRLHVIANSDSEYDQNAKEIIKSELHEYISNLVSGCASAEEAERIIGENINSINEYAEKKIYMLGYEYDVKTEISECYYSVREAGGLVFPSGKYVSLKVMLGKADGKNWWCVLYPDIAVCTKSESAVKLEDAGVSDDIVKIVEEPEKYRATLYLYEFINKLLNKDLE